MSAVSAENLEVFHCSDKESPASTDCLQVWKTFGNAFIRSNLLRCLTLNCTGHFYVGSEGGDSTELRCLFG